MLFLSVGSNYRFTQALKHCFAIGRPKDGQKLQKLLVEHYSGQKALLFGRGRDALATAIRTATGGEGSVLVTSLTCYSVIDAVKVAGCEVIYADISPKTLQFDEKTVKIALQKQNIKAIIIQNTLGIAVDIQPIIDLARAHDLVIIEDVAHSIGGHYQDGREIGTVGDMTMLSFGRDKLIDTINGGALVIRANSLPATINPPHFFPGNIRQLRDRIYPPIGWLARLLFPIGLGKYVIAISYKLHLAKRSADGQADPDMRLPHWQAKLAYRQIKNLAENVENRLKNQAQYLKTLEKFSPQPSSNAIRLPLLIENRDEVMQILKQAGIHAIDSWYEVPVSPERLYHLVNFDETTYPVVNEVSKHIINLPTHQQVKTKDIERIAEIINRSAKPWSM